MLAEAVTDPIAAELPSVPMRVRTTTWGVIRQLSAAGIRFTAAEVHSRVRGKVAGAEHATRYVDDLVAAGYLARTTGAIGRRDARLALARDQDEPPVIQGMRPEPVAFYAARLPVQIPRTHDGLWMLMRWLHTNKGGFTASDLRVQIGENIAWDEVTAYLKALDRGGYVAREGGAAHDPLYRLVKLQAETPRLRADGAVVSASQRADYLWRAMKMLTFFTPRELAVAASSEEWPISVEQASRYAIDLAAAGYLMVREGEQGAVFRLKNRMNTGPAAPQVLRARFVWDPNLGRIMSETAFAEEVRR